MNLQELRALVDYHYWARDRLLDAAGRLSREQLTRDLGNSFPSIRDTLVHLYGAERIWCARWEGESPQSMPTAGDYPDLPSIHTAWAEQEQKVRSVLEKLGEQGVAQPITYQTMAGEPQAQSFWQMLQHLVNHGSYHRGQVTTMMRQLGVAPPKGMDLIAFYRERGAAAMR